MSSPFPLPVPYPNRFADPGNLAFRAACNEVVPESQRPIKRRDILRISQSIDTRDTLTRLWETTAPQHDVEFMEALITDPLWKTLVVEQIVEGKTWSAVTEPSKVFEYLKSLFEKLWDGKHHPAAKTASAIVLSLAGIGATEHFLPGAITIPVTPVLSKDANGKSLPVQLQVDGSAEPIKVQYKPDDPSATIPVALQFAANAKPIDLQFSAADGSSKTIQDISTQIAATNSSISKAASDLHQITNRPLSVDTSGLDANMDKISTELAEARTRLDNLNQGMSSLRTSMEANAKAQKTSFEKQTDVINQSLAGVIQSSQHDIRSLVLRQGVTRGEVLPYLADNSGRMSAIAVKLDAQKIGKDDKGRFIRLNWTVNGASQTQMIYEGQTYPFSKSPEYEVSLGTTSRNWIVNKTAEVTLTPHAP